ncbi:hypothetical protein NM94018_2130, partial [Neisseria meningitidis 94018]
MIWVSDGIFYSRTAAPFRLVPSPIPQLSVIPATLRHSRNSPSFPQLSVIPATLRHSRDSPSFPRKWESRNAKLQEF